MVTAFATLVSLQNNLLLIQNHPRHSFSFEDKQIKSLLLCVCFLIYFMKYMDGSHGAAKEAAEAFHRRIVRAVQAAEDVIESHVVHQIRAGSTLAGKTTPRFLLDLQKVIGNMDSVIRKAMTVQKSLHDLETGDPKSSTEAAAAATTSSTPPAYEKNRMVGFDDELLHLVDLLTGVPPSRRVIPIVGMGGIGKTTLATNAFQHSYILQYFHVRRWATVSQEYSVQKILTQLLSSLLSQEMERFSSKMSTSVTNVHELADKLYKSLYGRRYLIILDDAWSVIALSLTFPSSLRRLNLSECRLGWEDLTKMVGSLHHLGTLLLLEHSVIGSVWTPDEGGFLSLKQLLIYWIADRSHFPVLERISLIYLSELDEFPSGIELISNESGGGTRGAGE